MSRIIAIGIVVNIIIILILIIIAIVIRLRLRTCHVNIEDVQLSIISLIRIIEDD